ncbi:MAG: GNAT family N-acetyltransferase [Bacillota bacterium]
MIKMLEELSLNAWAPLQTMMYDGWVLRFANGYTKRANSINALYEGKKDTDLKIAQCEKLYYGKNLKSVFKITPEVLPEKLDAVLEGRGYVAVDYTSVQTVSLEAIGGELPAGLKVFDEVNEAWISNFVTLNKVPEKDISTMMAMLHNIVPKKFLVYLEDNGCVAACGLGVLEGRHIGLFDIVTHQEKRRMGYGEKLVKGIMQLGKMHGADIAYLQVVANNNPALELYNKLGFREAYTYWYRVK